MQIITLNILKTGNNVFLTGSAGTGKTFVLQEYIDYLRDNKIFPTILAPTGIAASLLKGKTIHSFFSLGIKDSFSDEDIFDIVTKTYLKKRFENLQVLIIDEISMVSPTIFTVMDKILQGFRKNNRPFGGVQVILSGDFFQLPPIHKEPTNKRFAWQSPSWKDADFQTCYLTKKYRQEQKNHLVTILDNIREGKISQETINLLDSRIDAELDLENEATKLYTHNYDVDNINIQELEKLSGELHIYPFSKSGTSKNVETILRNSLLSPTLQLKKDTLVMFIKNAKEGEYVNGTTGKVIGFNKETDAPIVQIFKDIKIEVQKEKWTIENELGDELASVMQYPLKLAWAITVHKSQGMTLSSAEIDLSKTFETGQGYVALSRIRDLNGLRLNGYNEKALQVDQIILDIDKRIKDSSKKSEEKFAQISEQELNQLHETFMQKIKKATASQTRNKKIPTHILTKELSLTCSSIEEIAKKRDLTVGTVVNHLKKARKEDKDFKMDNLMPSDIPIDRIRQAREDILKEGNEENFTPVGEVKLSTVLQRVEGIGYDELHIAMLFIT
jgi:hypothetical protein